MEEIKENIITLFVKVMTGDLIQVEYDKKTGLGGLRKILNDSILKTNMYFPLSRTFFFSLEEENENKYFDLSLLSSGDMIGVVIIDNHGDIPVGHVESGRAFDDEKVYEYVNFVYYKNSYKKCFICFKIDLLFYLRRILNE